MRRIETAIDIAASPAAVWSVLAGFAAYPEWNPFIRKLEGEPRAGTRLSVTAQPPGHREMTFKPTVLVADANRELRWRGRALIPGIFDGEHAMRLEAVPGGTLFHHEEKFGGILVPLFGSVLEATVRGFEQMNAALKSRAERRG